MAEIGADHHIVDEAIGADLDAADGGEKFRDSHEQKSEIRNPNLGGQNEIEVTAKNAKNTKISNREILQIRESREGKTGAKQSMPFCAQFK